MEKCKLKLTESKKRLQIIALPNGCPFDLNLKLMTFQASKFKMTRVTVFYGVQMTQQKLAGA